VTAPQYDRYCTVTDREFEILSLSGDKDLPNKLTRSVIPCTHEIMPTCKGCGLKVKRSGLFPHLRRIQDPRCKTYLKLLLDAQGVLRKVPKGKKQKKSSQTNEEPEPMILRPSKSTPNFVMGLRESTDCNALKAFNPITHHFDDDQGNNTTEDGQRAPEAAEREPQAQEHSEDADEQDELDEAAACIAEDEHRLEPTRQPALSEGNPDNDPAPLDVAQAESEPEILEAQALCREAERSLENHPYITKYPGNIAGTVHASSSSTENQRYANQVGDTSQANPFAPFASKMEWDIAKWAKLRGASSTAFTELMGIAEVRSSYRQLHL
jgi:hypothetical protein